MRDNSRHIYSGCTGLFVSKLTPTTRVIASVLAQGLLLLIDPTLCVVTPLQTLRVHQQRTRSGQGCIPTRRVGTIEGYLFNALHQCRTRRLVRFVLILVQRGWQLEIVLFHLGVDRLR